MNKKIFIVATVLFASATVTAQQDAKSQIAATATNEWLTYDFGGKFRARYDHFDGLYSNDSTAESEAYLRRADFEVSGLFLQKLEYELELKINNEGDTSLKTFTLGYQLPENVSIKIGRMDPDFGLELSGSSTWTTAVERSSIWDLSPDAGEGEDGAGILLRNTSKHHFVSIDTIDRGEFENFHARIVYAPIQQKKHLLHLGYSYSNANGYQSNGRIRSDLSVWGLDISDNGNSTQLAREEKTLAFNDDRTDVIEFAYLYGPFSLQAEHLSRNLIRSAPQNNRSAKGSYLQIAYTLTGESRGYSMDEAKFGRIEPTRHGIGAWEVFYRKDWLDTNGETGMLSRKRDSGSAEVDVLGINWYIDKHCRLSLNYLKGYAPEIPNDAGDQRGDALTAQIMYRF
jgi:phosphate-selective porin OprO and OprP